MNRPAFLPGGCCGREFPTARHSSRQGTGPL
jgi:hypothetical protein